MDRMQFFKEVEQRVKPSLNTASVMVYYAPEIDEWLQFIHPEYCHTDSDFRFVYYIGSKQRVIPESMFDKYYLGATKKAQELFGIKYDSKLDVEYNNEDVIKAANNLHYAIMLDLEKYFFGKTIDKE